MENAVSENSMDKFNRRLQIATECVAQKTDQKKSSKIQHRKGKRWETTVVQETKAIQGEGLTFN